MAIGPDVRSTGGPVLTDFEGCVRLSGGPDVSFDIRACDPKGGYGPAYAFGERVSEGTIELQLEATTLHTLLVIDQEGVAVERFAWRLLDEYQYRARDTDQRLDDNGLLRDTRISGPGGYFAPAEAERKQHASGRVELRAGRHAFVVQVDAADFAPAQAGPFAAGSAPAEIRLVLKRAPGLRGRVLFDGQGIAGASVKLQSMPAQERAPLINGFPSRVMPWAISNKKIVADGNFLLPLRSAGESVIQAGADGKGSVEFGPRRYSVLTGAEGIVLVLPGAGAIEGRLLLADGDLERYRVIAGSCGDGDAYSVHTDGEGRFLFEGLRPGSWVLHPSDTDLVRGQVHSVTIRNTAAQTEPRALCEVFAGRTTRLEIDLRNKAVVIAELRLAGWEGAPRRLSLEPLGTTFSRGASSENPVEPQRVRVDQPGDYLLHLLLQTSEPERSLVVEEPLRLEAGENAWKFESAVGELVLVNTLDTEVRAWLSCELGERRIAYAGAKLAPHEERRLGGLPVGLWKPIRWEDGRQVGQGGIEITAGASVRMEWQ